LIKTPLWSLSMTRRNEAIKSKLSWANRRRAQCQPVTRVYWSPPSDEYIFANFEMEDQVDSPAPPYVSPPKWHLAHTSWFFDCFILEPLESRLKQQTLSQYHDLFNSYIKVRAPTGCSPNRGSIVTATVWKKIMALSSSRLRDAIYSITGSWIRSPSNNGLISLLEYSMNNSISGKLLFMDIKFILGNHALGLWRMNGGVDADKNYFPPGRWVVSSRQGKISPCSEPYFNCVFLW